MENHQRIAKQINPFTDYGFKKIFGIEPNKDLLIGFINGVLEGEREVKSVTFLNSERHPSTKDGKTIYIDVLCRGNDDSVFVVEMQRALKSNFLQRLLFYGCRLISEQLKIGDRYNIKPVYVISLLDSEIKDNPHIRSDYSMIRKQDGNSDLKELRIILFQLERFNMKVKECLTLYNKWLYLLKNIEYMECLPKELQNKLAEKLMKITSIEAMDEKERAKYETSKMEYAHLKDYFDYAKAEGEAKGRIEGRMEGRTEGKAEVAVTLKARGFPTKIISECTGLTEEQINNL